MVSLGGGPVSFPCLKCGRGRPWVPLVVSGGLWQLTKALCREAGAWVAGGQPGCLCVAGIASMALVLSPSPSSPERVKKVLSSRSPAHTGGCVPEGRRRASGQGAFPVRGRYSGTLPTQILSGPRGVRGSPRPVPMEHTDLESRLEWQVRACRRPGLCNVGRKSGFVIYTMGF